LRALVPETPLPTGRGTHEPSCLFEVRGRSKVWAICMRSDIEQVVGPEGTTIAETPFPGVYKGCTPGYGQSLALGYPQR